MQNPFSPTVKQETYDDWLRQFRREEIPLIQKLVNHFSFYDPTAVTQKLIKLYEYIKNQEAVDIDQLYFCPVGYVVKSGSVISYFFKTQNGIPDNRFLSIDQIMNGGVPNQSQVVFLDDYIGTGSQAVQLWYGLLDSPEFMRTFSLSMFAAISVNEEGFERIRSETGFRTQYVDLMKRSQKPFAEKSVVFTDPVEREEARQIVLGYGQRIMSEFPLGYGECQGLTGFYYNTPNNTLPIFWSTRDGWKPILPHRESFRDPTSLFGPPLEERAEPVSDFQKSFSDQGTLGALQIEPEVVTQIFNEFRRVDIFVELAPVIVKLGIGNTEIAFFIRMINLLKSLNHEQQPVKCSFAILPEQQEISNLGELFIAPREKLENIERSIIESIAGLIGGEEGAMVFDRRGKYLGSVVFPKRKSTPVSLTPNRELRIADASRDSSALLFYFGGNGRASVYFEGRRILCFRGASWHRQPQEVNRGAAHLARRETIDTLGLQKVFELSVELSNRGLGGLITVGNGEEVLNYAEAPIDLGLEWKQMSVATSHNNILLGLVSQDGATVLDDMGNVLQAATFLRPPPDAEGIVEAGRGSKHSTAAKISSVAQCVAFAVSVDGGITVYSRGEVALKFVG